MRPISLRRRPKAPAEVHAVVRVDRRTKDLVKRLRPGDVAVIHHQDLDRVSAESLVAARPAAVVNATLSISGRYPNVGPKILVDNGIPLLDDAGESVMELRDGAPVRLLHTERGARLVVDDTEIDAGTLLESDDVTAAMEAAKAGVSDQLEAFAQNTMEYMLKERDLLLDGVGIPVVRTKFEQRHALVVVRGYHYQEDLQTLGPYIREYRPVIIGVDGGADAVLAAGHRLDMIVGDMDSVSDHALKSGAEIVVHAYRDGRAPGMERVEELGLEAVVFPAAGTSEDVAMLLADDKGAVVIVAVGTHATLEEFLDKGRKGMSSTFLTRLRVGSKLVDAKGVSRLYRQRISTWQLAMLMGACLFAFMVALMSTPTGRAVLTLLAGTVRDLLEPVGNVLGRLL